MSRNVIICLLAAIVALHVGLAASYASITPYRQAGILLGVNDPKTGLPQEVTDVGAPDERQHVNYVSHLLNGQGFPVFDPKDPNLGETYQSHQPPAFYLLAAGWCKLTGADNLETKDSGIKLRWLNVFLGAGTVVGVFFLACWGFRQPTVALAAAAFAAFVPMFTALAGAVSNDPLLILLCTWVLAITAKCLREGWTWKRVIIIGALAGLALLTKTTALALVPILLVAAFLPVHLDSEDAAPQQAKRPSLAMIGSAAVLAIILVGPWWARNQRHYHDPLAIAAFNAAFTNSAQKTGMISMIDAVNPGGNSEVSYWTDYVGWWSARSFFGTFGYMDIWLNERGTSFTGTSSKGAAPNTLYRLLIAVSALCFVGWLLSLSKDEFKDARSIQILNGTFFLVVLLLFVRFNMQYFQAQARYLYPAIGPIACGFGIGASTLLAKRRQFALPALAIIFLGINFFAISQLPDAFAKRTDTISRLR